MDKQVNKEAYLKELQAILNADKWWSMTDDHRYYMKMSKIRQEIVKLKLELDKEESK